MKIRLATLNTPVFDHAGLQLNERWQEVDLEKLGLDGFAAVAKYRGHILQVHPADASRFDELVPQIDAAVAERAERDAAAKARTDKVAEKSDLATARRALGELRDELERVNRIAAKHASESDAYAALADQANSELQRVQQAHADTRAELEQLQAEHEQLKATVAMTSAPIGTNTGDTQLDATKTEPMKSEPETEPTKTEKPKRK